MQVSVMTPSAVGKLVEKWRKAAELCDCNARHAASENDRYFWITKKREHIHSADELEQALVTAPPEQANDRCPTCTSSVRTIKSGFAYGVLEPGDCNDRWHDPPQPASDGALDDSFALIVKDLREAKATMNGKPVMEVSVGMNWIADRIEAALASHDQKVRAEALEEAAQMIDQCNREGPYNAIQGASRIRALAAEEKTK